MTVKLNQIGDCHRVNKPWGYELWLQSGSAEYPYALKKLKLVSGAQTSLQVHQYKSESILILEGYGLLSYHESKFDCERFLCGGYSADEVDAIKHQLVLKEIGPGAVFHTPPGTIHRMLAYSDLVYIETSTTQLDDVIRLEDSSNRPHGRIEAEHAK